MSSPAPDRLPRHRPPCSPAEGAAASIVAARLEPLGFQTLVEEFRAPASAVPTRFAGALLRLATAVLLLQGAFGLAAAASGVALAMEIAAAVNLTLPVLTRTSRNVVARLPTAGPTDDPPLVVVAPLDTGGRPPGARLPAIGLALASVIAAVAGLFVAGPARVAGVLLGIATLIDIASIARSANARELAADAAGLVALTRIAALAARRPPVRELWLVAAGASTTGEHGVRHFLNRHADAARRAWVILLGPLGAGEPTLVRGTRTVVPREALQAVVRAVAGAAIDTGDAIDVVRAAPGTAAQALALAKRIPAVTITGTDGPGDRETIVRVARIVHRVARTTL